MWLTQGWAGMTVNAVSRKDAFPVRNQITRMTPSEHFGSTIVAVSAHAQQKLAKIPETVVWFSKFTILYCRTTISGIFLAIACLLHRGKSLYPVGQNLGQVTSFCDWVTHEVVMLKDALQFSYSVALKLALSWL